MKISHTLFLLQFSSVLFAQNPASDADTFSIPEIKVFANKVNTTAFNSPNKVQVISSNIISSLSGNHLADALNIADGIFLKDYSGLKTVSLNGSQAEHTLILLDGVKLNNSQNELFDISLLQMISFSKIEISKGGLSSLYGSDAIGGVISISSDQSLNSKLSLSVGSEFASFGYNKYYIKGTKGFKLSSGDKIVFNSSFLNEHSDNNFKYNFNNGFSSVIKERANSDYLNRSFSFNALIQTKKYGSLSLSAMYTYWDRSLPGPEFGNSPSKSKQTDKYLVSSVSYDRDLSPTVNFRTALNYKYSLQKYFDPSTYNLSQPVNSFYKENTLENTAEVSVIFNDAQLILSSNLGYSTISSNEVFAPGLVKAAVSSILKYDLNKDRNWAVSLFPSLRYDYYSDIKMGVLSSKLGVNIQPVKKIQFAVKVSAGNNFRGPSFNDLYWDKLGNKNLRPEKSFGFDAGLYYDFDFISRNHFEASYYNITANDRILWAPDINGIWHPSNIGKVISSGIDMTFNVNVTPFKNFKTLFAVNYNYGTALNKSNDNTQNYNKQLIYLPQEFAKAYSLVSYDINGTNINKVYANIFYNFSGKRFTDSENKNFIPFYDIVDVNAGIVLNAFTTSLDLKFAVNNVTNKDYKVMPGYPMPLRNYKLSIGINY